MPKLELDLEPSLAERLRNAVLHLDTTPEDFVKSSLEAKLSEVEADFQKAAEYVLTKNAELYRRLA